jgi:hypothetical protein
MSASAFSSLITVFTGIATEVKAEWARIGYTEGKVGIYGLLPWLESTPPWMQDWGPQSPSNSADMSAWQASNDELLPLARAIDFLGPSLYTSFAPVTLGATAPSVNDWLTPMSTQLAEENRIAGLAGIAVYPFMLPDGLQSRSSERRK